MTDTQNTTQQTMQTNDTDAVATVCPTATIPSDWDLRPAKNTCQNVVTLCGTVQEPPKFTHEVFGEKFFEVTLAVKRTSGTDDLLPVSIAQNMLDGSFVPGATVAIEGQFRSYNKTVNEKSKLMLTVFVQRVLKPQIDGLPANPNLLQLTGFICKPPVFRTTPFNREICDVLVAVNRQYNKSDYIPLIVWGRNARYASTLSVGDKIAVTGRVQSRNYQKKLSEETTVTRTAYEVSVSSIKVE